MSQRPLGLDYPGGCFIGFNAGIDRKAAEQLAFMFSDAWKNRFDTVTLLISSTGGILDHAYYLCSVLDALPIKIVAYNIGGVMSAANLLFLCADERYATKGSTFYFHQTQYPPPNGQVTESFARTHAKAIARDDARTAGIIAEKIGGSVKDVRRWQRTELFMDTSTALARGVIHGIKAPIITPESFFHQVVI